MTTKKLLLSIVAFVFCVVSINATNVKKASFVGSAVITDVDASLSFFVPEEFNTVFVNVSDHEKNVFQKIKVYQRGNGTIICDKDNLEAGTYYYTMVVDGVEVDTQKLVIKSKL